MREICLDTETTGLDPRSGDRIVEVACVEIINKIRTGKFFHKYINPQRDMPEGAFKVHGLSTEFLQDKPLFADIADEFLDFIKGDILVIHNASFDLKFLNHELSLLNKEPLDKSNVADSLLIARKKFPGSPNSLDALCKRFNVDLSKREKHGALLDTELLVDVYVELMGGAQAGLSFGDQKNDDFDEEKAVVFEFNKLKESLPKRDFPVSEEDLNKHLEFIQNNLKGNFWGY
jgi:DNA polymerase III subunit epsilon